MTLSDDSDGDLSQASVRGPASRLRTFATRVSRFRSRCADVLNAGPPDGVHIVDGLTWLPRSTKDGTTR